MRPRFVSLIPLREGSKGILGKNIKPIAGHPLCAWTLRAALDSTRLNGVYVSTESPTIRAVVGEIDPRITIIDRPTALASDDASTESVMLHFAERVAFDVLVTIQATSPLLRAREIDEAVRLFEASKCDSMLSCVRTRRFFWTDDGQPVNYDPAHRPRRQDFAGTYMENGALYLTRREILQTQHNRLGGRIVVFEMPEESATEIDTPEDWRIAERTLLRRQSQSRQ